MSKLKMINQTICHICGNDTYEEGEKVDVGWGTSNGVKAGPDRCLTCCYEEPSPYAEGFDRLEEDHFRKCWELQIFPWPQIEMKKEKYDDKYKIWIENNVKEAYGNCKFYANWMAVDFPDLRLVEGIYYDAIWGKRDHFWCLDKNNIIIDPTVSQFPTKGTGPYYLSYLFNKKINVFIDAYDNFIVKEKDIERFIANWYIYENNISLSDYLGINEQEYILLFQNKKSLKQILQERIEKNDTLSKQIDSMIPEHYKGRPIISKEMRKKLDCPFEIEDNL